MGKGVMTDAFVLGKNMYPTWGKSAIQDEIDMPNVNPTQTIFHRLPFLYIFLISFLKWLTSENRFSCRSTMGFVLHQNVSLFYLFT